MGKKLELEGRTFGRLTVIDEVKDRAGTLRIWNCRCSCGNGHRVAGSYLVRGQSKSCGCLQPETAGAREYRHGGCGTRLYKIWGQIKQRCLNPNNPDADRYSARGITVCDEWLDFAPFQQWAQANGYRDDLSIDRINNDRGYAPGNCRWATRTEQVRNRSDNILVNYKGETLQVGVAAERAGLSLTAVRARLARGWSDERALSQPLDLKKRGKAHGSTLGEPSPRNE